jgi:hypothetical protein
LLDSFAAQTAPEKAVELRILLDIGEFDKDSLPDIQLEIFYCKYLNNYQHSDTWSQL